MGGLFFEIAIERTGSEAIDVAALHRAVWDRLAEELEHLRHPANAITTADYLPHTAYAGLDGDPYDRWDRSQTHLGFSFSDSAGCCSLSMRAALHWAEMAYLQSWRALAAGGWRIAEPDITVERELVRGPSEPLAYPGEGMFAIYRRSRGRALGDQGYGLDDDPVAGIGDSCALRWSELAPGADRDAVELCALTGHCQCDLCTTYRARSFPAEHHYDVAGVIKPVRRAWELLDAGAALEAEAAEAARAWDWRAPEGPPELAALSDWLGERAVVLPPHLLAGLVRNRARAT